MKRTDEEIILALEIIRDVCKEFENNCEHCPLRVPAGEFIGVGCGVEDRYPRAWKIKKRDDWMAFDNTRK